MACTLRLDQLCGSRGLKASKLSVARTNLKLGRRDKAVSLLLETIEDGDPNLRSDAALLLLQLARVNPVDLHPGAPPRVGRGFATFVPS